MTETTNLGLKIIEAHDLVDYAPFNTNANLIDTAVGDLQTAVAALPTVESAVTQNTTDITNLTTRVGTAEGNISTNASAISDLTAANNAQWTAINTNTSEVQSLQNRATALENKEGDILQHENGSDTINPTIIKKLTYIGSVSLDQNGHLNMTIPAGYLPASYSNVYVNASIYSRGSGSAYMPYTFTRVYLNTMGGLVISFQPLDDSGEILPAPELNNLKGMAEIIFV